MKRLLPSVVILALSIQLASCVVTPKAQQTYDWGFYDKELRGMSAMFGKDKAFVELAKLIQVEQAGKQVRFVYECGNNKGQEVIFQLQNQGSIELKSWKSIAFSKQPANDNKSKSSTLADDKQPQTKAEKSEADDKIFKPMTIKQMVEDSKLSVLKGHIYTTADLDHSRTQIKDIQRRITSEGTFYKCQFYTFQRSNPKVGPLRLIIVVLIDKNLRAKTLESNFILIEDKITVSDGNQKEVVTIEETKKTENDQCKSTTVQIKEEKVITTKQETENDPLCVKMRQGKCLQCRSGTRITNNGSCQLSDSFCEQYDESNDTCIVCSGGYALLKGKCSKCQ